ncbi:hypothetical protein EVY06_05905 [Citrobacter koseri]|uniref:Uncharacterized protein n=1 Tax=Citrobacter koseri TaxID=545 RepID=A0AAQ1A3N3_CITKO|nr:hypothetical protein AM351_23440 [Citrobacter koseri]AVK73929.1 hypothetical protein CEP66_24485 [Citrobacter koseri]PNN13253.1 hypothetical protein AL526_011325 [Citrobacter koseri]PNO79790.1 hypothetical protein MC77_012965 [Citrobacter koseri]RSC16347.1 hypothetical protein EGS84_05015 [Citrobacter koseri]
MFAGWRLTPYPAYRVRLIYAGWRLAPYPAYRVRIRRPDKRSAIRQPASRRNHFIRMGNIHRFFQHQRH